MKEWEVEFDPPAQRDYRQLESGARKSALSVVAELIEEGPDLGGAILMRSYRDTWRVRFHDGRYRMVYEVFRKRRRILILRIRPRSTVYEGMRDSD